MVLSKNIKGYLSVAAGFLINFVISYNFFIIHYLLQILGSKYCFSSINSYFASYLYHNGNTWVTPVKTYFLMPCSDICIYLTLTLGAKLSDKIGTRPTIFISLLLKNIAFALLYFFPNYFVDLIAMCILGLGGGIGNLAYIKNAWKYFPESQGLVNGIILGGGLQQIFLLLIKKKKKLIKMEYIQNIYLTDFQNLS